MAGGFIGLVQGKASACISLRLPRGAVEGSRELLKEP